MGQWFRKKCPKPHAHTNHNTHHHTIFTNHINRHTGRGQNRKHPGSVTHIIINFSHRQQTPWRGEHVCACCVSLSLLKFYDETWSLFLIQTTLWHQCLISASYSRVRQTHGVCGHRMSPHMWWININTHEKERELAALIHVWRKVVLKQKHQTQSKGGFV